MLSVLTLVSTPQTAEDEPEHMEELNRSVHTWIEESEHSGAGSDDGLSSPSAAGARWADFRADNTDSGLGIDHSQSIRRHVVIEESSEIGLALVLLCVRCCA